MLARKLGPSLGFFGWQTLFYFGFYSRLEAVILTTSAEPSLMRKRLKNVKIVTSYLPLLCKSYITKKHFI